MNKPELEALLEELDEALVKAFPGSSNHLSAVSNTRNAVWEMTSLPVLVEKASQTVLSVVCFM